MQIPKVSVGVLVIENNRILLGRRRAAHGAGTWAVPGGKLEFGETVEVCAKRKLFEETSLQLEQHRFGPYTNDILEEEGEHYVTVFIIALKVSGHVKLREPDKCEGWKWFEINALPSPLFMPLQALRNQGFLPRA